MGLLSCVDTNLDVQLAVGVGLLGNLLGHDVGHGRQGIVAKAGAGVDATLVLVLRVITLEVEVAVWRYASILDKDFIPFRNTEVYFAIRKATVH